MSHLLEACWCVWTGAHWWPRSVLSGDMNPDWWLEGKCTKCSSNRNPELPLWYKDTLIVVINKGTLLLHLTSTFFPMLLFLPLMNSEHPDWNQFTSRETGLCPSNILFPAQELEFPQYQEWVWTRSDWRHRCQSKSSKDPEFGFQKSFWRQFLVLHQKSEILGAGGGRKGVQKTLPDVPRCAAGLFAGGQTIWSSRALSRLSHHQLTGALSLSLSLSHSLFFPSFFAVSPPSNFPDTYCFHVFCRKRMTLVRQYNIWDDVLLTFTHSEENTRINNP